MDRTEFLEKRRSGIGASDVAPIMGLSPWKSALSVYLDKVEPLANEPLSPPLEWGIRKEPVIAAAIADHYPQWEISRLKAIVHKNHEFLAASPDRINGNGELIEIKTARDDRNLGDAETDQVPDYYWLQCQHQIECARSHYPEVELCWLFVLIGSSDFRRYRVVRDETYFPMALPILIDFWGHVLRKEPPPVDYASEDARKTLSRMNRPNEGESVELSTGIENEVLEYERLGKLIEDLKDAREIAKAKIIEEMKSANVGILPDRIVTRNIVNRCAYTVKASTYFNFSVKQNKGTK